MKKIFFTGILGLCLFEFFKVYLIMPFPGSQVWNTLDLAYFLHQFRFFFRGIFWLMILAGLFSAWKIIPKWLTIASLSAALGLTYLFNFRMAADVLFKEPKQLSFLDRESFKENDSLLVIAITKQGEAKAYPVRYIVYHHQVRDTLARDPVMVTYCSVCRTGRVFSPFINGKPEQFRLVGMDHFNAMFEDLGTGSWWQQATGEAVTGVLKGQKLLEMESMQLSAAEFFEAFPKGKIMAPDPNFISKYDSLGKFEKGKSESKLTGTDPFSWNEKSWVVGIEVDGQSKAYDWNQLKKEKSIRDRVGNKELILLMSKDSQSFVALQLPEESKSDHWTGDTLYLDSAAYLFTGKSLEPSRPDLIRVKAYQEFWHSWRKFRPDTEKHN
ncbi:MAG: DUF3179 domain-containing (seleno)protein [Algoriphagus sp.]|nr:DUF3179 domain-containing (seleno)protein [Algoriphagus sp.]